MELRYYRYIYLSQAPTLRNSLMSPKEYCSFALDCEEKGGGQGECESVRAETQIGEKTRKKKRI